MWDLHIYFLSGISFLRDMSKEEQWPFHLLNLLHILLFHTVMYILTYKSTLSFLLVSFEIAHISLTIFSPRSKEGLQRYCLYGYLFVYFLEEINLVWTH